MSSKVIAFNNWKSSKPLAIASMLGITAIWGWTFVVVQDAVNRMPVMDFLAIRFSIAAAAMFILKPRCLAGMNRTGYRHGVLLGIPLGLAYILQTYGLLHTSASVSAFITGMFMVLTPVLTWVLLRRRTTVIVWLAVAVATVGLGLLSLRGWSLGFGEVLTLGCALCFALQLVGLGEWSGRYDVYGLATLQVTTAAIIMLVASIQGGMELPPDGSVWGAVLITSVLATSFAFYVQTWVQSLISPAQTSIILTMEPVFAGIFGVLLAGNILSVRFLLGAACVLVAMLISGSNNPSARLKRRFWLSKNRAG